MSITCAWKLQGHISDKKNDEICYYQKKRSRVRFQPHKTPSAAEIFILIEVWRHTVVAYTCRHRSVRGKETLVRGTGGTGGTGHWPRRSIAPEAASLLTSCAQTRQIPATRILSTASLSAFLGGSSILIVTNNSHQQFKISKCSSSGRKQKIVGSATGQRT